MGDGWLSTLRRSCMGLRGACLRRHLHRHHLEQEVGPLQLAASFIPERLHSRAQYRDQPQGMPGAGRTRRPCGLKRKGAHKSVQAGRNIRHSLRNGFTAAPRSSWCTGLVSHHRLRKASRKLDSSIGEPEPHGLTVRDRAARLAARSRPSHPAPRFVTTAKRLFGERGTTSLNHNFLLSERELFLRSKLDSSDKTGGRVLRPRVAAALPEQTPTIPNIYRVGA